jgi:diadenosine tetraphosphate (Ap4A) HIT family hydrolase
MDSFPGGVISLPGGWSVNHYGGSEGFLRGLALQPFGHRMCLQDLTGEELEKLGPNLQALDRELTAYWEQQFPDDPLRRVYVLYFFETAFKSGARERFHLHVHVIPRSDRIGEALKGPDEDGILSVDGWHIRTLTPDGKVPEPYSRTSPTWAEQVNRLMDYLREHLPRAASGR